MRVLYALIVREGLKHTAAPERSALAVRPEEAPERLPVVPIPRPRPVLPTFQPTVLEARHGPLLAGIPHASGEHRRAFQQPRRYDRHAVLVDRRDIRRCWYLSTT